MVDLFTFIFTSPKFVDMAVTESSPFLCNRSSECILAELLK